MVSRLRPLSLALATSCALAPAPQPLEVWAFTAPWDAASNTSVRDYGTQLDAIVTGWIALDSVTGRPFEPFPFADTIRPTRRPDTVGADTARPPRRASLVTSWHGDRFHPETIRLLDRDPALLAEVAGDIARRIAAAGHRGVILDLEALETHDLPALLRVAGSIADSARARELGPIIIAIPAQDAAYPARPLLDIADLLLVMLYDQHWMGSEPGPISAPDWMANTLAQRIEEVGAERLIAGLPTYGYRWKRGETTEILAFTGADSIARAEGAPLERDSLTSTLRAARAGWEMWVTDAELLRQLVRQARELGVHRIALWRMGQEDPAIWGGALREAGGIPQVR